MTTMAKVSCISSRGTLLAPGMKEHCASLECVAGPPPQATPLQSVEPIQAAQTSNTLVMELNKITPDWHDMGYYKVVLILLYHELGLT
jgi:hypothetical protein